MSALSTARLKEKLARGQRLTDEELVRLELSAVSRYDALAKEDKSQSSTASGNSNSSSRGKIVQRRDATPPPPARDALDERARPVYHTSGKRAEQQAPPAPGAFSEDHMRELQELRELHESARQARATLDEQANELARLRRLRLAAAENPAAATTGVSTATAVREHAMPRPAPLPAPPSAWPPMSTTHESSAVAAASTVSFAGAAPPIMAPAPTASADPLPGQLRLHLATNHSKVYDLFREWDVDGGGTVRKVEIRRKFGCGFEAHRKFLLLRSVIALRLRRLRVLAFLSVPCHRCGAFSRLGGAAFCDRRAIREL